MPSRLSWTVLPLVAACGARTALTGTWSGTLVCPEEDLVAVTLALEAEQGDGYPGTLRFLQIRTRVEGLDGGTVEVRADLVHRVRVLETDVPDRFGLDVSAAVEADCTRNAAGASAPIGCDTVDLDVPTAVMGLGLETVDWDGLDTLSFPSASVCTLQLTR